jgi:hypothetical protein
MQYEYDKPETTLPAATQDRLLRAVCTAFDEACVADPAASNEALRMRVLAACEEFKLFQRLYCKLFASVTVRAQTPSELTKLDKLRRTVYQFLTDKQDGVNRRVSAAEAAARAQTLAMRVNMRAPKPGEAVPEQRLTHLPDDIAPIDIMATGPCTVAQGALAFA